MFCQRRHLWPILDIWSKMDLLSRICHTLAVKYTVCINTAVKEILRIRKVCIHIRSRCQAAFICCCCCNGTSIHKSHGCDLSALKLAAFPVGEVSGGMPDGKGVVGRCISCSEARAAKGGFHNSSCADQIRQPSVLGQFHINGRACRVNTQREFICSDICTL